MQRSQIYYRYIEKKKISVELIKEGTKLFIVIRQPGKRIIKDEIIQKQTKEKV